MPVVHVMKNEAPVNCRGLATRMPDGVDLKADLWGLFHEPAPVVLERTPYGRKRTDQAERASHDDRPLGRDAIARRFNENGYYYLVQECRGTGDSEGDFEKYTGETADTTATLKWVRNQPWCNGFIATIGFSYGAHCQWVAIGSGETEPDVAVVDCGGFFDARDSGVRQGGAFMLKQATWAHAQALRDAESVGDDEAAQRLRRQDVMDWLRKGPWVPGSSPLFAARKHEQALTEYWQHGEDSDFWNRRSLRAPIAALDQSRTAIFFVTSWHDTSLRGTLDNFSAVNRNIGRRPAPAILIGPWTHGDRWSRVAGEADFGPDSIPEAGLGASLTDQRQSFITAARKKTDLPFARVRWFEMGGGSGARLNSGAIDYGGTWRSSDSWPLPQARQTTFNLTRDGLGHEHDVGHFRQFTSNPDDPVPTLGGAINSGEPIMQGGMWDQRALDTRTDILRYQTSRLEYDIVLAGSIRASLRVSSEATDFDITIKLVDVYPDGLALNLSDGIMRARYRRSNGKAQLIQPGEIVELTVIGNPVCARVLAGHRIRLDIAGSNFPCFDVNPQTGRPEGTPGSKSIAVTTVYAGHSNPSALHLTTLPT